MEKFIAELDNFRQEIDQRIEIIKKQQPNKIGLEDTMRVMSAVMNYYERMKAIYESANSEDDDEEEDEISDDDISSMVGVFLKN